MHSSICTTGPLRLASPLGRCLTLVGWGEGLEPQESPYGLGCTAGLVEHVLNNLPVKQVLGERVGGDQPMNQVVVVITTYQGPPPEDDLFNGEDAEGGPQRLEGLLECPEESALGRSIFSLMAGDGLYRHGSVETAQETLSRPVLLIHCLPRKRSQPLAVEEDLMVR